MPRILVFCLALICLALGTLHVSPLPASAQSADGASAPRAAWPSAPANSEKSEKPRSAWGGGNAQRGAPAEEQSPGWWEYILSAQAYLYRQLTMAVVTLKHGDILSDGTILIGLSFLYGVFHAAGPGHGKAVISSYVLANGATVRRGILLSFLAAFMQAVTAVAIMGVVVLLLKAGRLEINSLMHQFKMASGVLITLTGGWLLFAYLRRRFAAPVLAPTGHGHNHDHHHHDENCGCGHAHMPDPAELKGNWSLTNAAAIIFSIGIRPCSGAIIVLGVAITQNMFVAGILATFAMAIGTALTVSVLAVLAVGSRDVALRFANSRWTAGIYDVAAIGGSLLVILLGAGLFWSSLGPASPF